MFKWEQGEVLVRRMTDDATVKGRVIAAVEVHYLGYMTDASGTLLLWRFEPADGLRLHVGPLSRRG